MTQKSKDDMDKTELASHVRTFERTFLKGLEKRVIQERLAANQAVAAF